MSSEIFLQSCVSNPQQALQMITQDPQLKFAQNSSGFNALHISAQAGNWNLFLTLLQNFKISPHKLPPSQQSVLHCVIEGFLANQPTEDDIAEFKEQTRQKWEAELKRAAQRFEENKSKHPDINVDDSILVGDFTQRLNQVFSSPMTAIINLLVEKYHVRLNYVNSNGETALQIANRLQSSEVADLLQRLDSHDSRQLRLLQLLNDSLFREVVMST